MVMEIFLFHTTEVSTNILIRKICDFTKYLSFLEVSIHISYRYLFNEVYGRFKPSGAMAGKTKVQFTTTRKGGIALM